MSSNFFRLPRELRNQIYELVLLHHEPISPLSRRYSSRRQHHTLGLLKVNKTINREASSLFYGQNRFDFTLVTCETLASFLGQIGRNNADCIRHIDIRFPHVCFDSEDVSIEQNIVEILANIQSNCANLSTLKIPLFSTHAMELQLAALESPKVATKALELANTHFRRIQSLEKIIVELGYFKFFEQVSCDSDRVGDDDDDDENLDIDTNSYFIEKSGV